MKTDDDERDLVIRKRRDGTTLMADRQTRGGVLLQIGVVRERMEWNFIFLTRAELARLSKMLTPPGKEGR